VTGAELDALVRAGLQELDLEGDPEIDGQWQYGFRIARRIYKVLFDADIVDLEGYGPGRFAPLVEAFYREAGNDDDTVEMIVAQFWEAWGAVCLPEGYDPFDFCYKLVLMNAEYEREELSSEYPNENQRICAKLIGATARSLQRIFGECIISTRKSAHWLSRTTVNETRLKCNHETAAVILRALTQDGTLRVLKPSTTTRARRFEYIPFAERKPKIDSGLQRIQKSQEISSTSRSILQPRLAGNSEGIPPGRARHFSTIVDTKKPTES